MLSDIQRLYERVSHPVWRLNIFWNMECDIIERVVVGMTHAIKSRLICITLRSEHTRKVTDM